MTVDAPIVNGYDPQHEQQAERHELAAGDAWRNLSRVVGGIRTLFGEGVAHALDRAAEDYSEHTGEAHYHRRKIAEQTIEALRVDVRILHGQAHAERERSRLLGGIVWSAFRSAEAIERETFEAVDSVGFHNAQRLVRTLGEVLEHAGPEPLALTDPDAEPF